MASYYYNENHSMQIIPDESSIYKIIRKNGVIKGYKINGINTWSDWHLIPSSRPIFNSPKVKTNYIDLPGANGFIDATQVLSSYIYYQNREGTNEFYVANGYGDWASKFSEIMNYLHGRRFKIILKDDPHFYYRGRLSVNQWKSEKDFSKIIFDYNLEPYKYELLSTNDDWLWDPFNFYTGIIRKKSNYTEVVMTSTSSNRKFEMDFYPREMPVIPTITISYSNGQEAVPKGDGTYDAETIENYKVAYEVTEGLWGNGDVRVTRLTEAGYDYQLIQDIVNVCYEVDYGEWGPDGTELKQALETAGFVYDGVMAVIESSYGGEWDPNGRLTPSPDPGPDPGPDPEPEPAAHVITVMTATAKGKKGTKRSILLPEQGKTRTYRYPDLIISKTHPKLIFTLEENMTITVSVFYRGGML